MTDETVSAWRDIWAKAKAVVAKIAEWPKASMFTLGFITALALRALV